VSKADNLTTILGHCHGSLNFLEPSGHLGPVMGLTDFFFLPSTVCWTEHRCRIFCNVAPLIIAGIADVSVEYIARIVSLHIAHLRLVCHN